MSTQHSIYFARLHAIQALYQYQHSTDSIDDIGLQFKKRNSKVKFVTDWPYFDTLLHLYSRYDYYLRFILSVSTKRNLCIIDTIIVKLCLIEVLHIRSNHLAVLKSYRIQLSNFSSVSTFQTLVQVIEQLI